MKIRYYLFCIRWLYRHRSWKNTRQKFKAMDIDFHREQRAREQWEKAK